MDKRPHNERGNISLKFLDRYLGIPLLRVLGLVRKKRRMPRDVHRIAVLKTVAIGDTVLLSGVIADLKKAFPGSHITFLSGTSNHEASALIRGVDEIVQLDMRNILENISIVRREIYDVFLDFGSWARINALISFFSRSAFTVGFETGGQYRHYAYDAVVHHSGKIHELENYRNIVRAIEVEPSSPPDLELPSPAYDEVACKLPKMEYVVFHPWPGGTKSHYKEWPADRWIRLAQEINRMGFPVLFTGAEPDRKRTENILTRFDDRSMAINLAGKHTLCSTAILLKNAVLLVTVNTGIMHVGAALGVPLVALHGPTSSKRWGPYMKNGCQIAIESPISGCGYLNLGFDYPANPPRCMEGISVEEVLRAAERLIKGRSHPYSETVGESLSHPAG